MRDNHHRDTLIAGSYFILGAIVGVIAGLMLASTFQLIPGVTV